MVCFSKLLDQSLEFVSPKSYPQSLPFHVAALVLILLRVFFRHNNHRAHDSYGKAVNKFSGLKNFQSYLWNFQNFFQFHVPIF